MHKALATGSRRSARSLVMDIDRNGMLVLSQEECILRLGDRGVGRVAVSIGALPAIFPVNYATCAGDVYFRAAAGTKLAAATRNAVVAFEIDDLDRLSHTGWSVQVVGPAAVVDDPDDIYRLRSLPLVRWIGAAPDTLVRISSDLVSGREICSHSVDECRRVHGALINAGRGFR